MRLPARMEADDGALPEPTLKADSPRDLRWPEPADLDVQADADTDVTPLLSKLRLLRPQTGVIDMRQRLVQRTRIISAVVLQTRDDVVTVLEGRNQILPSQVRWIHLQLVGEPIDDAFQHERRLRASLAAVRLDRRGVGIHAVHVFLHGANLIRARQHQAVKNRRNAWCRGRQVTAHPGPNGASQAEDAPVFGGRHLHVLYVIASVRG